LKIHSVEKLSDSFREAKVSFTTESGHCWIYCFTGTLDPEASLMAPFSSVVARRVPVLGRNVCFTPESRHKLDLAKESAFDP
jgi:hypothetical protein